MTAALPLKGKVVFITGATSGFGLAFAKKCIKNGAKVVASGRREERLAKLKKFLGNNLHTLVLDVRDPKAVEKAVKSLPKAFASIDILINNAGLASGLNNADEASISDWDLMVDTNIKGLTYCTHAILPGMVKRGRGHIVNIGSVAGSYPYPGGNVYGGTKAFVKQFSLNLRAELLGKNIRVSNIEPGMAETEFSVVRFHGDKSKAKNVYAGIKALSADDIAESVLYCLTAPAHVNINSIEIMPTNQAFSGFAVHRTYNG